MFGGLVSFFFVFFFIYLKKKGGNHKEDIGILEKKMEYVTACLLGFISNFIETHLTTSEMGKEGSHRSNYLWHKSIPINFEIF